MKNRQDQFFRDGPLFGHVIACNDQYALIEFESVTGFVSLAADCDGDHSLLMTIGLPPHVLTPAIVKRLHQAVLRFFECDLSDCLLVTTQPMRIARATSYVLPASKIPSRLAAKPTAEPVELFSFPRRFDLASMLAISSGYAFLFAAMRLFDASPYLMFSTGGLLATVGVSQAILFSGKEPRKASLIVGGVYCAIAAGIATATAGRPNEVAAACTFAFFWGPLAGYITGAIVGGVFLIAEYVRRAITKFKAQRTQQTKPANTSVDDGEFRTKHDC